MKTLKTMGALMIMLLLFALPFGCSPKGGLITHEDIVYGTKRLELRISGKDNTKRTPLIGMEKTFVKEKFSQNDYTIKVYDVATLSSPGFRLEEKVYIIADDKVHKMNLSRIENDMARTISTSTDNILKSDSTTVSVITGQTEHNRQVTKLNYQLSKASIADIKAARQVSFRYYAGPSMITVKLSNNNLRRLKSLMVL